MKIKLKSRVLGYPKGTTLDIADKLAKNLVEDGDAVFIKVKGERPTISNKAMSAV